MDTTEALDFDQLALQIRNPTSRRFFEEAATCLRINCLRECIVATWGAVAYDLLSKFGEVDLLGDEHTQEKLQDLKSYTTIGRMAATEAANFERNILTAAETKLGLITTNEREQLARLHTDRNRCIHPEMQSVGEPYAPNMYQARLHLRNAVELVLAREPAQGRAAVQTIWQEIHSESFPTTVAGAVSRLKSLHVGNTQKPLVRGLIAKLLHDGLLSVRPATTLERLFAAIAAFAQLFPSLTSYILQRQLPAVFYQIHDDRWPWLLWLCRHWSGAWAAMDEPMQAHVVEWVKNAGQKDRLRALTDALAIPDLRPAASESIERLGPEAVQELIASGKPAICVGPAIGLFCSAKSVADVDIRGEALLVPVAEFATVEHIRQVAEAVIDNQYIRESWRALNDWLPAFFSSAEVPVQLPKEARESLRLVLDDLGDNGKKLSRILAAPAADAAGKNASSSEPVGQDAAMSFEWLDHWTSNPELET